MLSSLTEWVKTSPADDFWLLALGLAAASVASFIAAYIFFYRKRLFEDIPTSKIRSAAQGYVEFSGQGLLMEGPPITAPLTSTTSTWYYARVEEKRGSGKNEHWVTIKKELSDELFLIKDETGACVVDPEGAKVTPTVKDIWYGHTPTPTPRPRGSKQQKRSGLMSRFSIGIGRYRYTEERMHPGDPLYAIGLFRTEGGAGGNFDINEDVRELLREWKQDSNTMLANFDKNGDGEICMEEWQEARETALAQVQQRHAEEKIAMPTHVMGKTCDRRRPYILSAVPETDLVSRYTFYNRAGKMLFFICGAAATWLITLRLTG